MKQLRAAHYLYELAVLAAVYVAAGKGGLALAFVHSSASAVWPPTGIALAALLVGGFRLWPAILLGAFLVNVTTAGSTATSVGIAAGNTLEALVGAYLVGRFAHGRCAFEQWPDVFKFAILAAAGSTTLSASVGATSLLLGGFLEAERYPAVWLTWWLGDMMGALIVTPLLVLWLNGPRPRWSAPQLLEALAMLLVIIVTGQLVFGWLLPGLTIHYPLTFLCLPPLLWPAFRLGNREAATAGFLMTVVAVWGTLRRLGPFVRDSPNESLLLLQSFLGLIAVTAVAVGAAVVDRKRFETRLLHAADHDPLTELLSRRRFVEELGSHLAQARRYGTRGALLFLDLDDFKRVNDALGHGAGDRVLSGVARRLQGRLRDSDILGRLGGDEFAILLPHADHAQGLAVATQLLEAIRERPIEVAGRAVRTRVSIGLALYPEHGTTSEELLGRADSAMYEAKRRGGNTAHALALDARLPRSRRAPGGESSLREALAKGSLLLHAQPILDLRSDRIRLHELLVRMTAETGELLAPDASLSREQAGSFPGIERWVVRQAIQLLGHKRDVPPEHVLFVNVSGQAFSDRELVPLIGRELAATRVDPARLVLGVTDTGIDDLDQAREFSLAVKQLGCGFALDGFGAAFSSFAHLKHLPIDYLKIDGSYVRDLPASPLDRSLVKAMVEMAHALQKKTVAEGVGDDETLRLVRASGIDFAQGAYVGAPRAVSEIWKDAC